MGSDRLFYFADFFSPTQTSGEPMDNGPMNCLRKADLQSRACLVLPSSKSSPYEPDYDETRIE